VQNRLGPQAVRSSRISLEIFYNRFDPFTKAELAYGLALLFLLISLAVRRFWLERLSLLCLIFGFLPHTFGMAARMLIMGRPPVTNLYETFVFVAWAGVAMGLLMAWWQKKALGILAGGLAGLVFLVIAGRYSLDGDTMGMLAAVLDSNLWLATHVVTISLGYAGCVVAGIIGHAVIIQELLDPRSGAAASTARPLYAALAFGLAFTCIGTAMGGIWADQSWGRFWGWDPKENGALLIIIWCAILFHARLAGWIGHIGLAAGSIGAIIAVVLAWFGVNLLGVGMHAYGFTSGAARGLLAFVAGELIFLAVAVPLIRKKSRP
jgi:ABC-type transport system involved in cytochrome c biogenesis permease subunit